jgi:hypothetical protein
MRGRDGISASCFLPPLSPPPSTAQCAPRYSPTHPSLHLPPVDMSSEAPLTPLQDRSNAPDAPPAAADKATQDALIKALTAKNDALNQLLNGMVKKKGRGRKKRARHVYVCYDLKPSPSFFFPETTRTTRQLQLMHRPLTRPRLRPTTPAMGASLPDTSALSRRSPT